jgi:methyl-accepting chemotaxis protein
MLVALAVALAAGCGGDDENAAEAWADSVCSSIGDWRTDVDENIQELSENPGAISADSLRAAADESLESTQSLVDELRGLGAPDTESGEQAREELEQLLESLEERVERVREAAEAADEGVAEIVAVIASVSNEVQGAADDARETLNELREIDPGGDLEQAFQDTDSCESLQD